MPEIFQYRIPRQLSGERADKIIRQALKESGQDSYTQRSQLADLFLAGKVLMNGQPVPASKRLKSHETLTYSLPEQVSAVKSKPDILPKKIYENEHFLVFQKPPFMAMHGGEGLRPSEYTFADYLEEHYPVTAGIGDSSSRPGIVHRLDKDTSGVLLVAKTNEAYNGLKELFLGRKIEKTYLALCYGSFREEHGSIDLPLRRQKHSLKRAVLRSKREDLRALAKDALTEYQVLATFTGASLVLIKPKTGRMHQIRVHMQALHKPILGDRLYGTKDAIAQHPDIKRQMLHALRLEFTFEGVEYSFEALPPEDFRVALESLDGFQGSGYDYEALKSLFDE